MHGQWSEIRARISFCFSLAVVLEVIFPFVHPLFNVILRPVDDNLFRHNDDEHRLDESVVHPSLHPPSFGISAELVALYFTAKEIHCSLGVKTDLERVWESV